MQTRTQSEAVANLVESFGVINLDYENGNAYLWTADAVEYVVRGDGKVRVNYVHPARSPHIAGLLTA